MAKPSDSAALKTPDKKPVESTEDKQRRFDVRKSVRKALKTFPKSFKKLSE